jgi:hypothetical protein
MTALHVTTRSIHVRLGHEGLHLNITHLRSFGLGQKFYLMNLTDISTLHYFLIVKVN